MHLVEEYQDIIALTEDRLNECEIVTPTRRRYTLNYYITQCTGNSISWGSGELETRCSREASTQQSGPSGLRLSSCSWRSDQLGIRRVGDKTLDWGTCPREAGPLGPRLSSPGERKRNAVVAIGVGSICCSSVSPTPSHTQPFQIKWEVYFSKNCVTRLYCVVVMILHAYVDVYVLCVCKVGHDITTIVVYSYADACRTITTTK